MHNGRVRVLHVITRLVIGGAQENTLLTVTHLDRSRYDVTLASGPTTGPEGSLEDHIPPWTTFRRVPGLVRQPSPVSDIRALATLYTLMRQHRYHLVHTHTTKAGILGRIAARWARVPIIIHTPHGHAFHSYLDRARSEALRRVERWLAGWTDQIVCLTEAEQDDHVRMGIGTPDRFEVIHSGVDIDRFRTGHLDASAKRRELGLPPTGPLVGCVARLVPIKGVQYLLDAAPQIRAAVPQATVVYVGDGSLRPELERRASLLGLDRTVAFLGLRRDVPEIMPLFDLVVLPSLNEGMGKAAVEAMATGLPVIGSRVSGIQEVVTDGVTGLLVPPADPPALARAIVRCLTNPDLALAMGQRGKIRAGAYSISAMMAKIERLYDRWLVAKRVSSVRDRAD